MFPKNHQLVLSAKDTLILENVSKKMVMNNTSSILHREKDLKKHRGTNFLVIKRSMVKMDL
jgi:hypothetical protein